MDTLFDLPAEPEVCSDCGGSGRQFEERLGEYKTCHCRIQTVAHEAQVGIDRSAGKAAVTAPDFQAAFYDGIRRCAEEREEFFVDDVWNLTGLEAPEDADARCIGHLFQRAARAGLIEKTDRVKPSVRSHLSGKPVWRSKR